MHAVFFRNLNLGHPNCPSKVQLESAFMNAGAKSASSFLTNGTIAFPARSLQSAEKILLRAGKLLQTECSLQEPGFLRKISYLEKLVASTPFASINRDDVYDCYITFLHADANIDHPMPWANKRQDMEILQFTAGEAFSVVRKLGKSAGSPNAFLEKQLGLPCTTRAWNTVVRLVNKHAHD